MANMNQRLDPVSLDALARLLARRDPPDLPRRARVSRYGGDPDRRTTRLPGILMAWLQQRHLDIDGEELLTSATRLRSRGLRRVKPGLRVLRPTGTG